MIFPSLHPWISIKIMRFTIITIPICDIRVHLGVVEDSIDHHNIDHAELAEFYFTTQQEIVKLLL